MLRGGKYRLTLITQIFSGHCKKMVPEYIKAGKILAEKDLYVAKIDGTVNTKTGEKYGI